MGPLVLREDSLIMVKKEEECSFDVLLTYRFFFFFFIKLFIYLSAYLFTGPLFSAGLLDFLLSLLEK